MLTFTTVIIIAVVCIIIGLGTGMLIVMASNRGNEAKAAAAPPSNGRYRAIAALLRDGDDESLVAEIDGHLFASAETLNDEQRDLLEKTARDLHTWLKMIPPPEDNLFAAAPPFRRNAAEARKTVPMLENERDPVIDRPITIRTGGFVPPIVAAAVASNVEKKHVTAPLSIVGQIDEILQDMVAGTPLAEKSIRLVDDPVKGVIVWIGLEHYEGINNVPDIESRTIIQAAVREWEKRSEIKPK